MSGPARDRPRAEAEEAGGERPTPAPPGTATPEPSPPAYTATASGSWPGTDVRETHDVVFGELGAHDGVGLPFLPSLPARGPGADPAGYAAGLLVELPVDLQPHGWRLVDHPGKDSRRTDAFRNMDVDTLAEFGDGYRGPLKVQLLGPWSLASRIWLPRGERVVVDFGARRDLLQSYAEGSAEFLRRVQSAVPGARLVVQLDEHSLSHVLEGRLPTISGFGRLPAVPEAHVRGGLTSFVRRLHAAGAEQVAVRLIAGSATDSGAAGYDTGLSWGSAEGPRPLIDFLRDVGADAVALDVAGLKSEQWESVAGWVESGRRLWAGLTAPDADPRSVVTAGVESVRRPWRDLGLPLSGLADVVATTAGELADRSPSAARAAIGYVHDVARALREAAEDA